ncbi:MAG: hypothetical protein IH931_05435 [candidate division Zixibacteria bacterium]|nr:hypothetical protein [candidate division Zixibacteria bacterium]
MIKTCMNYQIFVTAVMLTCLLGCAEKRTPSRDHIPLIKEKLSYLQNGVLTRNRAVIDSVLSVKILDIGQSSDSLLKFIYGADNSFAFEFFGEPVIIYTDKVAMIECYLMDSTRTKNRPTTLLFSYDDDIWLLSRFEKRGAGESRAD